MTDYLEPRLLSSFLMVADELSFTRAARRLHMTQPPLSLQIKQLEGRLGTTLFDRTNRHVRLTAAGETLRVEAEKMLAMNTFVQELVARVGRGEVGGHIAVGFTAVASIQFVPELLSRFSTKVPEVLYSLQDCGSEAQISALLRNELDVGFVRPPVVDSRLDSFCVQREKHVLAIPVAHRLATANSLKVGDLKNVQLVAYERRAGRYVNDLIMRWLSDFNVLPSRFHDVVHHNALMTMVSAGLGLAIVPKSATTRAWGGVVFREFTEGPYPPQIELWIAFRKSTSNPLTAVLVEEARHFSPNFIDD